MCGLCLMLCPLVVLTVSAEPGLATPSPQQAGSFDYQTALAVSQAAIGNQTGDYPALDATGKSLSLAAFRGKPMVLSFIYTSCYEICPMTTRYLGDMVDKARDALGQDSFTAVTIGFDTQTDTPDAMRHFASKQDIDDRGWHLLSMRAGDVESLANEVGFLYYPKPHGFDHLIQTTVIDAQGRVYRQVYGQAFATPLLVEPLMDLVLGRERPEETILADLVNKVRLFCTIYDPSRDGYYFNYSLFIGMTIGALIIVLVSVFLVREILLRRRTQAT